MNKDDKSSTSWYSCEVHPKEAVVGVCHLCLNDRLLFILATKQPRLRHHHHSHRIVSRNSDHNYMTSSSSNTLNRSIKSQIKFPNNIFRCYSHHATATPDQDLFISIKIEDNGVASWDKSNSVSKVSLDHCNISWNKTTKLEINNNNLEGKNVIKNPETPRGRSMWWRKRIGHMVQLIRLRRSSCHSNVRTSNGANGLIRTETKRKTKEYVCY